MPATSCQYLASVIKQLQTQQTAFDDFRLPGSHKDINQASNLRQKISQNQKEILRELWPLEILTREKLREQYDSQKEAYLAVGLIKQLPSGKIGFIEQGREYIYPTLKQVNNYLKSDPEIMATLLKKETQGFTQLLITPFAMNIDTIARTVERKVKAQGGKGNNYWSDEWKDQAHLRYFIQLNSDGTLSNGLTKAQVKDKPGFLLNGYFISLREDNPKIPYRDDPDTDYNGRIRLKSGKTAQEYLDILQNPNNPHHAMYQGEDAMLPEEWFALFAEDLYKQYISQNKQIEQDGSSKLLDFNRWCWFVSTKFQGSGRLPDAFWRPDRRGVRLDGDDLGRADGGLGVRPVVRKKA